MVTRDAHKRTAVENIDDVGEREALPFEQALRALAVLVTLADDVARVSAAHAQAILVGESLMRQADVEAATRALLTL